MRFAVKIETCNETWYEWKKTEEEMLDYILNDMFHTDRDEEWKTRYFVTDKNAYCIEERDGDLYSHWMTRDFTDDSLLFPDRNMANYGTDGRPQTIPELRELLKRGETVTMSQDSRSHGCCSMIQLRRAGVE